MCVCLLLTLAMDALADSPLGWLCVGITALFGVTVFCTAKRSPVGKENVLVWSLLPALLGLLCVAMLGTGEGLVVFCASCLVSSMYLSSTVLLPVSDKAVLITGRVLQACFGKQNWLFSQVG